MWTILKRQCSAVWFVSGEEWGRVLIDDESRVEAVEPDVADLLAEAEVAGPGDDVELHEFGGAVVLVSSFAEGCVAVLLAPNGNMLAARAALRRWPGHEMLRAAKETPAEENTARVSASALLLAESRKGGTSADGRSPAAGTSEATGEGGHGSLDFDSFAEESVMGPNGQLEKELHEATRIMACTWVQVVEHFGRISELIAKKAGVDGVAEEFEAVRSPLGKKLSLFEEDFTTSHPSERVDRANAEAVEAVYRVWIDRLINKSGIDLRRRIPAIDVTPWRGLLVERDAPVEPISFSF